MSVYNDIRSALETQIASVSGIPAADKRAWENVKFEPTAGATWVRMTLIPATARPAVIGPTPQKRFSGIFQVDVFVKAGQGAAGAETLADAIRDAFAPGDQLTANSTTVRIDWSERDAGIVDGAWYRVPVSISWFTYRT